ncbi:hypothetical protein BDW22DRAFT_1483768 [Trametopsis cervina]|nr:hypothetical protein BDW22DRAFT_1483768 [Trametopsis cervina]
MFRGPKTTHAHAHTPLRLPRLLSHALLFAFGIIAMSVGINALAKFNNSTRDLKRAAPAGSTVSVDTHDVLDTGYNITVISGVLALLALFSLVPTAGRFLRVQAALLAFFTLWLFAALVAFDVFFANRSAKVVARIGNIVIDPKTVQTIIAGLGATTVYRRVSYLRLPAIIPWFTVLFGASSAVLSFLASRRTTMANSYPVSSAGVDRAAVSEKERSSVVQQEAA